MRLTWRAILFGHLKVSTSVKRKWETEEW